jgi:hypothetical protein
LEDGRILAKSIAEQLGISCERVGSIIHEDLDMLVDCFLPGRAKDISNVIKYQNLHIFELLFMPLTANIERRGVKMCQIAVCEVLIATSTKALLKACRFMVYDISVNCNWVATRWQ